jgi:cytochrome c-type biogenesis protein
MFFTFGLSFAAGVLAALSPCVLPVLPLVVGSAARTHRAGPFALAAGLVATFTTVGVLLASLGARLPIDDAMVRYASATLLGLAGLVMMSAWLHDRVSGAFTPLATTAARLSSRVGDGLGGQFAVGALLGGVWSPCVGPMLGTALGLAGESDSRMRAVLMLMAFGLGSATPLVAMAYASRTVLSRRATLLRAGYVGQMMLGGVLVLTAALVWSGFDKVIEASVVEHLPSWWIALLASV